MIGEICANLLTIPNLVLSLAACFLGIVIGAIPGLTVTLGIILLLPLTYGMTKTTAILTLLSVYVGGCYGGSISAILINIPGTNSALATTLDGHPMAKKGMAYKALSTSLFASSLGGFLGALILLFAAKPIAQLASYCRSPEYFSLALFGMTVIAGVSGKNIVKGLISTAVGIFISCIGMESLSGTFRYTFDTNFLMGGINMVPALIGLIALTQVVLSSVEEKQKHYLVTDDTMTAKNLDDPPINRKEMLSVLPTIIKSVLIGTVIGAMPGAGGEVATFLSYNEAKRTSKHPELFGTGCIEGIAAPESSNNTVVGTAMIPLLTLGIPGDGVTAILLGALTLHGMEPGPQLFTKQAVATYSIIVGLIICNIFLYIEGRIFTKQISKIIKIPFSILGTAITMFCFSGAFSSGGNISQMMVIVPLALFGYYLNQFGYSVIPMMLGLILGPIVEKNFTRSMIAYHDDVFVFFKQPVSCAILILAVVSTALIMRMNNSMETKAASQVAEAEAKAISEQNTKR